MDLYEDRVTYLTNNGVMNKKTNIFDDFIDDDVKSNSVLNSNNVNDIEDEYFQNLNLNNMNNNVESNSNIDSAFNVNLNNVIDLNGDSEPSDIELNYSINPSYATNIIDKKNVGNIINQDIDIKVKDNNVNLNSNSNMDNEVNNYIKIENSKINSTNNNINWVNVWNIIENIEKQVSYSSRSNTKFKSILYTLAYNDI